MIQNIDVEIERGARELSKGASIDVGHGLGIYEKKFLPEFKENPALAAFLPVWQEAFLKALENTHVSEGQKILIFTHLVKDFGPEEIADSLLEIFRRMHDLPFLISANDIVCTMNKFEGHPIRAFLQDVT